MKYLRSLTKPPSSFGDQNKWADYLEILCLSSMDKIVSADDIYDKLFGDKSDDEASIETDDIEIDDIENDIAETFINSPSELADKNLSKINDKFEFLVSRRALFGEYYPFKILLSPKSIELKEKLSYKHYSYLGLLISSNLDYFSYFKSDLTTKFEMNSLFVFKKLFPEQSNIEYFGKGAERSSVFSQSKLLERLKVLAKKLSLPITSYVTEDEIGKYNTGDGGLDIVGWYDIGDDNSGKVVNFAQCACGKEWFDKQFDICIAKWDRYIHPNHPILTTLITPSSFRKYDGTWYKESRIYQCIIIDRVRFLKSLRKRENSKVAASTMEIVKIVEQINFDHFN